MDNRALAALLSSLISELLLLLLLLPISTTPSSATDSPFNSLFISTATASAATLSLLSARRKRPRSPEPDAPSKLPRRVQRPDSPIPRSPDSFKLCFKMTSSTFEWLSSLLEPLLECRDPVDSPLNLPVETRLGIGLFRLATGSGYPDVSRRFRVSEPVARFCVGQLCRVLCTNFRFWVGFPTQAELRPVSDSFESLTGLPNCCGVIHCARFKILKNENEESVAAQFVVDSSSKILSIVAGINGKKGNHLVLKSSTLYKDIQSNNLLNLNSSTPIDINGVSIPQYLIGDKGYPFLPWLMVPFDQPVLNSHEDNFNSAHDLMLASGFRTVDSLKKWGVLSKPIKEEMKTMVGYIGACSILHNALLMREDYSSLSDECLRDTGSHSDHGDFSFEDDLVEEKSFKIRSALATRARRCS